MTHVSRLPRARRAKHRATCQAAWKKCAVRRAPHRDRGHDRAHPTVSTAPPRAKLLAARCTASCAARRDTTSLCSHPSRTALPSQPSTPKPRGPSAFTRAQMCTWQRTVGEQVRRHSPYLAWPPHVSPQAVCASRYAATTGAWCLWCEAPTHVHLRKWDCTCVLVAPAGTLSATGCSQARYPRKLGRSQHSP